MNTSLIQSGLLLAGCTLVVLAAWRRLRDMPLGQSEKRRRVLAVAIMFTIVEVTLLLFVIAELKMTP